MPTSATSAEIARLPASIRQQALFSARLNTIGPTVEIGNSIKEILDGNISMSEARVKIRKSLNATGYKPPPGKEGTLLDHTSDARQNLILKHNIRKTRGYAYWAEGMDPDILDTWPALELLRVEERNAKRDWMGIWQAAGGQIVEGRMVALKTSPVWRNISRFGDPFPPFDYGSGMGVEEIERDEAVRLGLLREDDVLTPEEPEFADVPEANLPGIEKMPELQEAIKKAMGEYAEIKNGVLSILTPNPGKVGAVSSAKNLALPKSLFDTSIARAAADIKEGEARALIARGNATVVSPTGQRVRFTQGTIDHWEKSKNPAQRRKAQERIPSLRRAFDAVEEPQESWEHRHDKNPRTYYLKTTADKNGNTIRTMVSVKKDGEVATWVESRENYINRQRHGELLHLQGES